MGTKGAKVDTWQKRVVQEAVERTAAPFTAQDLCATLARVRSRVSRATVYRMLATLCAEGRVREVSLSDGRRVCAKVADRGALCIIECLDCGRLAACVAPDLGADLDHEVRKHNFDPAHASVHMRARCQESGCGNRQSEAARDDAKRPSAKPARGKLRKPVAP